LHFKNIPRYNWKLRVNKHKIFPADRNFSIVNLTHAIRVCVKAFSIRYEVHWYDFEQPDFLNKREKQL
jgi:hypothetical protein